MIKLGSFDSTVSQTNISEYKQIVASTTRVSVNEIKGGSDKLIFKKHHPNSRQNMGVAEFRGI